MCTPLGTALVKTVRSEAGKSNRIHQFNFIRDIAPVAAIIRIPLVVVVNSSFPAQTVPELIAYAKANPGKIYMVSAGIGSATQVSGELFKMMAGVKPVHMPYRGTAPHSPICSPDSCKC
jgi:tripartite-type tricarboxylate transporter receptor subunit TctC